MGVGTRVSPQATLSGHERIAALNASGKLAYLKSVTRQTHIALTRHPLTRAEMVSLTRQLAQDPRVEYAEVDEKAYPHVAINDPLYNTATMWNLQAPGLYAGGANLTNAWNRMVGGTPVSGAGAVIAVLDTGYLPHADLIANVVSGYDFVTDPADHDPVPGRDGDARDPGNWNADATIADCAVQDSTWHGTRVAGIVSATANNHTGIIGAAYGAKVLPVRVLGACGGYISDIAAGMYWAAGLHVDGVPDNTAHIAKVINLSLGASGACSSTFQSAVTAVRGAGSVVVASTGNDGSPDTITQPANCAGVIAVTAHTSTGESPSYANVGPGTTLSAPGGISYPSGPADGNAIYSTANTGTTVPVADAYAYGSGTSFAAPHVAAVAALLFQTKPTITPDELQSRLTSSARAFLLQWQDHVWRRPARCGCSHRAGTGGHGALHAGIREQAQSGGARYLSAADRSSNARRREQCGHDHFKRSLDTNCGPCGSHHRRQHHGCILHHTGHRNGFRPSGLPFQGNQCGPREPGHHGIGQSGLCYSGAFHCAATVHWRWWGRRPAMGRVAGPANPLLPCLVHAQTVGNDATPTPIARQQPRLLRQPGVPGGRL